MSLILVCLMLVMIIIMLMAIQTIIGMMVMESDMQLNSLESGFESLKSAYFMSSPFFFLAVLFVLFDLELLLLFPGVMSSSYAGYTGFMWVISVLFILITLLMEWAWCGLKWQV